MNRDDKAIPDETTWLHLRHWLKRHGLTERLFAEIQAALHEQGLSMSAGTMVDATMIHALPATRSREEKRGLQMHPTRKGTPWYFGMQSHVGADGTVHHVTVTPAHTTDISEWPKLLRDTDRVVFGDSGDAADRHKRQARQQGIRWCVNDKRKPKRTLSSGQRSRNRRHASIRARVEHVCRIITCHSPTPVSATRDWPRTGRKSWALANLYPVR